MADSYQGIKKQYGQFCEVYMWDWLNRHVLRDNLQQFLSNIFLSRKCESKSDNNLNVGM